MKKPNITEGEWRYTKYTVDDINCVNMVGDNIFVFLHQAYWDVNNEDMQAISAVPEMIDALLYIKNNATFYNSAIEMDHNANGEEAKRLINKALEKAGGIDE